MTPTTTKRKPHPPGRMITRFAAYRAEWARLCVLGGRLTVLRDRGKAGTEEYRSTEAEYRAALAKIRAAQDGGQ